MRYRNPSTMKVAWSTVACLVVLFLVGIHDCKNHPSGLLAVDAFAIRSVRQPLSSIVATPSVPLVFRQQQQQHEPPHTRRHERTFASVPCLRLQLHRPSSHNSHTTPGETTHEHGVASEENDLVSRLARSVLFGGGIGTRTRNPISKHAVLLTAAASLWLLGATAGGGIAAAYASETTPQQTQTQQTNPEYLSITERDIEIFANKKLVDYAIGTVNTQFYDNSGGYKFNPSDFYRQWKAIQRDLETTTNNAASNNDDDNNSNRNSNANGLRLDTRDGTVETLKYLVSSLNDPYSNYMTREELRYELKGTHDGFLGTGAYIELPKPSSASSSEALTTMASAPAALSVRTHNTGVVDPNKNNNNNNNNFQRTIARATLLKKTTRGGKASNRHQILTTTRVANLPVVTAVAPNSPAERSGLVVGDRIVAVGDGDSFVGYGKDEIARCLAQKWGYGRSDGSSGNNNGDGDHRYFGVADLTIAKPVYSYSAAVGYYNDNSNAASDYDSSGSSNSVLPERDIVVGYRSTKVKLPTKATDDRASAISSSSSSSRLVGGNRNEHNNLRGDSVVQHELLTSSSPGAGGIFNAALRSSPADDEIPNYSSAGAKDGADRHEQPATDDTNKNTNKVGYIRLTRFSKSSTEGYLTAVQTLEDEGAQSYIIDLRNNYGGVIQEAMLVASTLIGDPHALLCYLLNARGGFTPVDVESYVVDPRYPGYLLSGEPKSVVLKQVMKEHPAMFRTVRVADDDGGDTSSSINSNQNQILLGGGGGKRVIVDWDPPSSYASIHEQVVKRGIHRISYASNEENAAFGAAVPIAGSSSTLHKNQNSMLAVRQRQLQQKMLQKDVVLLINEGTASSAEFFVAALQDNGRVAVVGTKSFGKGLIQHTFPMPDGGGLKLTIGEYLRPSLRHVTNLFDAKFYDKNTGEFVLGGGIRPDVYCDSKQGIPGNPKADLCVGVALDVLEEEKSAKVAVSTRTDTTTTTATATTRALSGANDIARKPGTL